VTNRAARAGDHTVSLLPPNDTPQDMRDLLIRLDERVQNGFASISAQLNAITTRTDNHEHEINLIKTKVATHESLLDRKMIAIAKITDEVENVKRWRWMLGGALTVIGIIVGMLGYNIVVEPKRAAAQPPINYPHPG
jgi:hypothetical protein